jgi:hypothetical protein
MMTRREIRGLGMAAAAAVLMVTGAPALASGELPILRECLSRVDQAREPSLARNQCLWEHYERMASYGP